MIRKATKFILQNTLAKLYRVFPSEIGPCRVTSSSSSDELRGGHFGEKQADI